MKKLAIILILFTLAGCQRGKLKEPITRDKNGIHHHWYKYDINTFDHRCECGERF
jgi:hypothetical protein